MNPRDLLRHFKEATSGQVGRNSLVFNTGGVFESNKRRSRLGKFNQSMVMATEEKRDSSVLSMSS